LATPAEVRRLGALEVGFPVTAGAMAGPLVFALLRMLLGGQPVDPAAGMHVVDLTVTPPSDVVATYSRLDSGLSLIPTSVSPAWWQTVTIVALVAAAGVATGAMVSRHLVASPLGVSRRERRPAPRPWGLLLVAAGLGAIALAASGAFGRGQAVVMAGILLVVLGVLALGPWGAFRSDPATLIAAGHLVSDPGPAGRAAAAVGAISIVSGVAAVMEVGVFFYGSFIDPFFVTSFALVGGALILVLLVTASTLAVHAAESLVDRRRVLAALVAAGTPLSVLRESLRREAMLTAMPLSVGGVLIGAVVAGVVGVAAADSTGTRMVNVAGLLFLCGQVAVTIGLTWAAIRIAIGAVAPRLLQATAPANLRTE